MPRGKSVSQFFTLWLSQPYPNYHISIKKSQAILILSLAFDLRWAQKTKPCFVTLATFFRSTASQGF